MIKAFFGLISFPFKKDVDDIFLSCQLDYLKKRCAHFLETQGLALITGEIGSGKTTFTRHFLGGLNPDTYRFFYLSQTPRSPRAFFKILAAELGLKPSLFLEDIAAQVKTTLSDIYHKQRAEPIIIVDEAQNLSDSVLEEIRLLTNFKMDSKNYLSILLLGHPVLKARLKLAPYAAFKQRLAFNYHLTGLEQDELKPYVLHRLKLAGRTATLFTDEALALIFNYSKGLPRVINALAHESLYQAATQEKTMIDEAIVERIVQEWDNL